MARKKYSYSAKKVRLGFRGFRTCFWEVDHPICDVWNNLIGAQVFGKGKIYKPTWTKTSLRLVFVLRWNYILLKGFPVFQIRRILILGVTNTYQDLYVYIVVCATICKVLNLSLKCFRQELELRNRRALSVSKYYRVFLFSNNVLSFIYNTADFLSIVFLIQWYLFGTAAVCCSI